MRPSAVSRLKASMTVVRESPRSRASVRVAGSRSPAAKPPFKISSRSTAQSCVARGWCAFGSIRMDSSSEPPARLTISKWYQQLFKVDLFRHPLGGHDGAMRIAKIATFCDAFVGFVRVTAADGAEGWGQVSPYHADLSVRVLH